jgi:hypothetical protein
MFPSRRFHQGLTGIIDAYAYDWLKRFRLLSIPRSCRIIPQTGPILPNALPDGGLARLAVYVAERALTEKTFATAC